MARQQDHRLRRGLRAYEQQLLAVPDRVLAAILAGCVLLFVAVPVLLYEANTGVTLMTSQEKSSVVSTWAKFDDQQECIRQAIMDNVPKGTAVLVSPDQSAYYQGQLIELSTPWARPVATRDQASYSLTIVAGTHCNGESLQVRPVR